MFWRFRAIMRTTAARLSALYLALFIVAAFILVQYMTSRTVNVMSSRVQASIEEEISGMRNAYRRGGMFNLIRETERRSRRPGAYLYIIADDKGNLITGNVSEIETGILNRDGWVMIPFEYRRLGEQRTRPVHPQRNFDGSNGDQPKKQLPTINERLKQDQTKQRRENNHPAHMQNDDNREFRAIARVFQLSNGVTLLVGRDIGEPEIIRNIVRNALMIALGVMVLGALLIWLIVGRYALRRIDAVSLASKRIMGGDLTGRLPVQGSGDEFDRLSDSLNLMLGRIEELHIGLKEVSDNISHDLKTPLTRLRNRAESAILSAKSNEEYRDALKGNIEEADRLISTFNAILMISRLESGAPAAEKQVLDLSHIITDVAELYEATVEEEGGELVVDTLLPTLVDGNRELIAQMLANLIDNALKYAGSDTRSPKVTIALQRLNERVVICVGDNGKGIVEADRERAVERFVRLDASRTTPGTGLGLSLVKAIAAFHGGSLTLGDNEPGLAVKITLPLSKTQ